MGEREFIMQAIDQVRPIVEKVGFEQIKIKDIISSLGVSKSKFFNYFGSLYGIMELMLHHELSRMYADLRQQTKGITHPQELLVVALQHRWQYIKGNKVLQQFYTKRNYLTSRFDALSNSVCETEAAFLQNYMRHYSFSEKQSAYFKQQIQNGSWGERFD